MTSAAAVVVLLVAIAVMSTRDQPRLDSAGSATTLTSPVGETTPDGPSSTTTTSSTSTAEIGSASSTSDLSETTTAVGASRDDELFLDEAGVREYLGAGPGTGVVETRLDSTGSAVATLTVDRHTTLVFGRSDSLTVPVVHPGATSTTSAATSTTSLNTLPRGPLLRVDEVVEVDLDMFQSVQFSGDVYACAVEAAERATVVAIVATHDVHVALEPDVVARAWTMDEAGHHEIDAASVICDEDYFEPGVIYLDAQCDDGKGCTSFASRRDGRIVAFDPVAGTLIVTSYAPDEHETIDVPGLAGTRAYLVTVGPDDVAYVTRQAPDQLDPIGDVLAISMASGNAGTIIATVDRAVDLSGDSSLVATSAGLVSVGCCSHEPVRPGPGEPLVIGWVDSSGAAITDAGPQMSVEVRDDGSLDVIRRDGAAELRWNVADVGFVRGMPPVVPSEDGGAMMLLSDIGSTEVRLVAMFTDGAVYDKTLAADAAPILRLMPDRRVLWCDDAFCFTDAPFG